MATFPSCPRGLSVFTYRRHQTPARRRPSRTYLSFVGVGEEVRGEWIGVAQALEHAVHETRVPQVDEPHCSALHGRRGPRPVVRVHAGHGVRGEERGAGSPPVTRSHYWGRGRLFRVSACSSQVLTLRGKPLPNGVQRIQGGGSDVQRDAGERDEQGIVLGVVVFVLFFHLRDFPTTPSAAVAHIHLAVDRELRSPVGRTSKERSHSFSHLCIGNPFVIAITPTTKMDFDCADRVFAGEGDEQGARRGRASDLHDEGLPPFPVSIHRIDLIANT